MAHEIFFSDETDEHLSALTAGQKAAVFEAIARQLPHEPTRKTRNRKPMDPDKRAFVAPWELRVGNLRVYYAVEEKPSPTVVVVAVGIKDQRAATYRGEGRGAMKAVEITETTLTDYGRRPRNDMWVLTRRGKPVAALVPIHSGVDLESFGLSHNPRFIQIVNRSWASYKKNGGVSLEEMRRRHGVERNASRRRKAR